MWFIVDLHDLYVSLRWLPLCILRMPDVQALVCDHSSEICIFNIPTAGDHKQVLLFHISKVKHQITDRPYSTQDVHKVCVCPLQHQGLCAAKCQP